MINITRHAIIIGSPGKPQKELRGVYADITEFPIFLQSANGGGFSPREITVLNNPSSSAVLEVLASVHADYVLIYYSGHGAMDEHAKQLIALKDAMLHEDQLKCASEKTLLVFDACRNRPGRARISGLPWAVENHLHFSGISEVRNAFNNAIHSSLPGRTVLYATADGTGAFDDDQDGGYFTRGLFESVIGAQREGRHGWMSIESVTEDAASFLRSRPADRLQVPQCIQREGDLSVPFAFVSPNLTFSASSTKMPVAARKNQAEKAFLIAGGFVLAALLLDEYA